MKLTYIFDLRWLKYAKFVWCSILPHSQKYEQISISDINTVFLIRDIELYFQDRKLQILICKFWKLTANFVTIGIVLPDIGVLFEGLKMLISLLIS